MGQRIATNVSTTFLESKKRKKKKFNESESVKTKEGWWVKMGLNKILALHFKNI